jgi:hypothetical protein
MDVELDEWLTLLQREYLEDFVKAGGSAVKFAVVPNDRLAERVKDELTRRSQKLGYLITSVDAAYARIHLIDKLFHQVADQIPWTHQARELLLRAYQAQGCRVSEDVDLQAVADENGLSVQDLLVPVRRSLKELVNSQREFPKDFRYAMLWLCSAVAHFPGVGEDQALPIQEWLCGQLRLISALKEQLIFQKIGRHNARAMFSSLGSWTRLTGSTGLVLLLDIRALAVARKADSNGNFHYSPQAVMDAYEGLRQLVDAADELVGTLVVVVASPETFHDTTRGVKIYKALEERVWPDIRLKSRANPLSALTTLATDA